MRQKVKELQARIVKDRGMDRASIQFTRAEYRPVFAFYTPKQTFPL